jgi:hypothetical protein
MGLVRILCKYVNMGEITFDEIKEKINNPGVMQIDYVVGAQRCTSTTGCSDKLEAESAIGSSRR